LGQIVRAPIDYLLILKKGAITAARRPFPTWKLTSEVNVWAKRGHRFGTTPGAKSGRWGMVRARPCAPDLFHQCVTGISLTKLDVLKV